MNSLKHVSIFAIFLLAVSQGACIQACEREGTEATATGNGESMFTRGRVLGGLGVAAGTAAAAAYALWDRLPDGVRTTVTNNLGPVFIVGGLVVGGGAAYAATELIGGTIDVQEVAAEVAAELVSAEEKRLLAAPKVVMPWAAKLIAIFNACYNLPAVTITKWVAEIGEDPHALVTNAKFKGYLEGMTQRKQLGALLEVLRSHTVWFTNTSKAFLKEVMTVKQDAVIKALPTLDLAELLKADKHKKLRELLTPAQLGTLRDMVVMLAGWQKDQDKVQAMMLSATK